MLSALLSSPAIAMLLGGVVAVVIAYFKGGADTAKKMAAKQAAEEKRARDMADDIQNDVGALPPDAARKELRSWSHD